MNPEEIFSRIIQNFAMKPMDWASEIPAKTAFRGTVGVFGDQLDFWTWIQRNLPGWSYAKDWSNGYREV